MSISLLFVPTHFLFNDWLAQWTSANLPRSSARFDLKPRPLMFFRYYLPFLAHLSTKCSWWAIVVSGCPSSVVVRRPSCVVRRASTFDVYTLETTFVTWFWWNLIRMFVLTISRQSSNMSHVGSKTRSPGQISGNSCLHPRGHICDPILMKLCQNVCFDNI